MLATQACALDFRGVALGDTCRHAIERELALGTQPLHAREQMLRSNVAIFEDSKLANQHTEYVYDCTHTPGVVALYSIIVTTRSEARARSQYDKAKAAAAKRLGTAVDDSSFPEATEKLRQMRLKGITAIYAFADWKSADEQYVEVKLEKPQDATGPNAGAWSITTTVSKQPL